MTAAVIPLSAPLLKGNELKYLTECIETEWISSAGPFVDRFEKELAQYVGAPTAVACVNGTAALHISLILSGVAQNDEVILPTLTFIAPVNAVRYVGAQPVFMDCDDYLNLDPEKLLEFIKNECEHRAEGLINRNTGHRIQAIIVVHVFGHPANLLPIIEIAKKYNLKVIEDATESLGSCYNDVNGQKKHTGTLGDFGCFSFNGNKIITAGGGGMIVTNSAESARLARHLTTQAKSDPLFFKHDAVGYNYRLTNIQAAIGVAQLEQLDRFVQIKRDNFLKYCEVLKNTEGVSLIIEPANATSNYWHYGLVVDAQKGVWSRNQLMTHLRENKVEARPVWALCHKQEPYRNCYAYRIEKAEKYEDTILNIPCSVSLTDEQIDRVVKMIRSKPNG